MLRRLPLMLLAGVSLLAGLWAGLVRIGWAGLHVEALPVGAHGPLMACGFLGTLIALERAVALGRPWAYGAPLLTGLGGVVLLAGVPLRLGATLSAAGAAVLVAVFARLLRQHRPLFLWAMAAGALVWGVASAAWAAGASVPDVALGWMAFLVFTIVGERLELSRLVTQHRAVPGLVAALLGVLAAGAGASGLGLRAAGAGASGAALVLLAATMARADVARHTVRRRGLTRFMAVGLLCGYVWLAASGVLLLVAGADVAGPRYDAALHAVFLGFAMSMVFAHAPVILPAVLEVRLAYRPVLYAPLALLHASLLLRVVGDLASTDGLRRWGGMLSVVAILLYAVLVASGGAVARIRARCPIHRR